MAWVNVNLAKFGPTAGIGPTAWPGSISVWPSLGRVNGLNQLEFGRVWADCKVWANCMAWANFNLAKFLLAAWLGPTSTGDSYVAQAMQSAQPDKPTATNNQMHAELG